MGCFCQPQNSLPSYSMTSLVFRTLSVVHRSIELPQRHGQGRSTNHDAGSPAKPASPGPDPDPRAQPAPCSRSTGPPARTPGWSPAAATTPPAALSRRPPSAPCPRGPRARGASQHLRRPDPLGLLEHHRNEAERDRDQGGELGRPAADAAPRPREASIIASPISEGQVDHGEDRGRQDHQGQPARPASAARPSASRLKAATRPPRGKTTLIAKDSANIQVKYLEALAGRRRRRPAKAAQSAITQAAASAQRRRRSKPGRSRPARGRRPRSWQADRAREGAIRAATYRPNCCRRPKAHRASEQTPAIWTAFRAAPFQTLSLTIHMPGRAARVRDRASAGPRRSPPCRRSPRASGRGRAPDRRPASTPGGRGEHLPGLRRGPPRARTPRRPLSEWPLKTGTRTAVATTSIDRSPRILRVSFIILRSSPVQPRRRRTSIRGIRLKAILLRQRPGRDVPALEDRAATAPPARRWPPGPRPRPPGRWTPSLSSGPTSGASGASATTIWIVEQLGLAMTPLWRARSPGLTSGTTSGTVGVHPEGAAVVYHDVARGRDLAGVAPAEIAARRQEAHAGRSPRSCRRSPPG